MSCIVFLTGFLFLAYFTYLDVKFGEIDNWPIAAFFLAGLGFTLCYGKLNTVFALEGLFLILGYGMWKKKIIGGADAKILPCLVPFILFIKGGF